MKNLKNFLSYILIFAMIFQALLVNADTLDYKKEIEGHWAADYATRLINLHIINGYEDGTIRLNGTITRAEFTKILVTLRYGDYRTYETEVFSDVSKDAWYYNYISTAYDEDILEERKGTEFRPNDLITRVEMVVMIVNSLQLKGGKSNFTDVKKTYKYYDEICAAVKSGIITGYEDNTFRVDNTATRGETAAMVCRILDYITDSELTKPPSPTLDVLEEEEIEPDIDEEDEEFEEDEEVYIDTKIEGKINLTWHQIYTTGVTKTGDHMAGLNVISPTWFTMVDNTGLTPYSYEHEFYPELNLYIADLGNKEYIRDAHAEGYKVWAMFSSEGVCSKTTKLLNNADARAACVEKMREYVKKYDLDGINLDFENMYQTDRDVYTLFVKEMSQMCHEEGIVLSVDVTKYDATSSTYSLCYDRKAIAKYADYVALMAYDQNGTWSKTAGSVADLKWTEDALKKTLEEVPAQKLLLGIPFYARIWETKDGVVVKTSALGMQSIANKIEENGAEIVYDEKTGQNYAEWIKDDRVCKVWIEDETSVEARIDLVNKYNLAGVASWSKTFETPEIWDLIEELLE